MLQSQETYQLQVNNFRAVHHGSEITSVLEPKRRNFLPPEIEIIKSPVQLKNINKITEGKKHDDAYQLYTLPGFLQRMEKNHSPKAPSSFPSNCAMRHGFLVLISDRSMFLIFVSCLKRAILRLCVAELN